MPGKKTIPENFHIKVGLCAMAKKVKSKPMNEILKGILKSHYIKLIIFDENMILNDPIEKWPICDALISFYSQKFPLDKAIQYADLRKPYLINDLKLQKVLLNRKSVYELLERHDIPVPKYICVDRTKEDYEVVEVDDTIEIGGQSIQKPFVEKPLDAEDHNIYIYFPSSAGGGSQQLFRKVGDRSSKYSSVSTVRRDGSFLYETFMPTDGTDVKIYTVGDDYAHAEARKSPALDGKVERDHEGKEVRYPVILTLREKMMAKKVSQAFKQQICGFDLLRANGMSYVCDVNGFSFVKSSPKYYEDCAHILLLLITREIAPHLTKYTTSLQTNASKTHSALVPTTSGSIMELRCVIGIIRHGDRTPKQKLKMEVKDERLLQIYKKYSSERSKEIKLKKPTQLQEVLDIVRDILARANTDPEYSESIKEQKLKFMQIRNVLEMYGHFSGINRKIQMKKKLNGDCSIHKSQLTSSSSSSISSTNSTCECCAHLLLIVKWGGELTEAGRLQAEKLGKAFRRLYPSGNGNYNDDSGLGLLRLHSTYRHDLKIYASDEGRVQMTAAAFAKGFLALEGELPPILVQMVKSANTNGLLDNDNDCQHYKVLVKKKIFETMSQNKVLDNEDYEKVASTNTSSLVTALRHIGNPVLMCDTLLNYMINLNLHLNEFSTEQRANIPLYHDESWELLQRRWRKLLKDFKPKENYDLSKISDIYDNIKYDIQHNPAILIEEEEGAFFMCAKALADVIVPQEYGVTLEEKLVIGQRICTPLIRKILSDARYTGVDECTRLHAGYSKGVASPERFVRTRLYFTSESHLHALLNTIRYGGLTDPNQDEQWQRAMEYVNGVTELNYLSQIVIMIFEDPSCSNKGTKDKFHVELLFSPGAFTGLSIPGSIVESRSHNGSSSTDANVSQTSNSAIKPGSEFSGSKVVSDKSNTKLSSRSSSINDKTTSTPGEDDKENNTGFNMRDLMSKFSRKRSSKQRRSSRVRDTGGTCGGGGSGPGSTTGNVTPISSVSSSMNDDVVSGCSTTSSSGCITQTSVEQPTSSNSDQSTQSIDNENRQITKDIDGTTNDDVMTNDDATVTVTTSKGSPASTTKPLEIATDALLPVNDSWIPEASSRFTVTTVSSSVKNNYYNNATMSHTTMNSSIKNISENDVVNSMNDNIKCIYHKSHLSPEVFKSKEQSRKMSLATDLEGHQEVNYLTYPATDIALLNFLDIELKDSPFGINNLISRYGGSARTVSTSRPLISTDVIKGARMLMTGSIPDINTISGSTKDLNNPGFYGDDKERGDKSVNEGDFIPSAPCVPEIHSLETLHNSLTLSDLEDFLQGLVSQKYPTPCQSPK